MFPGVICDSMIPKPDVPKASCVRPYLLRYDGYWLDHMHELPYPLPPPGTSLEVHFENFEELRDLMGEKNAELVMVPAEDMNPFAVGHLINHPPPDVDANVKLIDFDLPYSFFPSTYGRYIPYIKGRDEQLRRSTEGVTRTDDVFRAVAVVASQTLSHGDELYVDYLQD